MRVAVSSVGKDENSQISMAGGRAPYYLIFEDGKLVKVISNPFRIGGGGAGFGVAEMLADEGVDVVISGKFGGNMKGALESKGIKYKEMLNITVKEAIEKL
ncbi:MAG: NifB/NifX family molybdenum-iron cluster-binding protein [Candidatus Aenigmarchaeota archaeon]|nr:NifB/NifX family molybdenum-iron cluster-binding protein [Candidatus Aenigmarchaeota archaeon]